MKFLAEAKLTYDGALKMAQAIWTAENNYKEVGQIKELGAPPMAEVNKVSLPLDKRKSDGACCSGKPSHL